MRLIRAEVCVAVLVSCFALTACGSRQAAPAAVASAAPTAVQTCSLLGKSQVALLLPAAGAPSKITIASTSYCAYGHEAYANLGNSEAPSGNPVTSVTWNREEVASDMRLHNGESMAREGGAPYVTAVTVSGTKAYAWSIPSPSDFYRAGLRLVAVKDGYAVAVEAITVPIDASGAFTLPQMEAILQAMLAKV